MRLVWAVIPLILIISMIGIVGIQESFATQCIGGIIRIEDQKLSSQYLEIGKDTLHISGKLVNLSDKSKDVLLSFRSSDTIGSQCSATIPWLPNFINEGLYFEKISGSPENIFLESNAEFPFEIELKPLKSGLYVVQPAALTKKYVNLGWGTTIIVTEMSPLKQVTNQILPENVTCNEKLELIFKSSDNSPVCVTSDTAAKLTMRGWIPAEKNIEPKPIPYIFPKNEDFFNFEISHYPKINEIATITMTSKNAYPFDLTLEDNEYFSIFLHGFEFVNVSKEKIRTEDNHTYSIHEPLLIKQNQTQSFAVEIRALPEHKHDIRVSGIRGTHDSLSLFINEFESISYNEYQDRRLTIEVTDEEYEKILQQQMKIKEESSQCNLVVENNWNSTSSHSKLLKNKHLCHHEVRDNAISSGIDLMNCYSVTPLESNSTKINGQPRSYTLEEALEIEIMRIGEKICLYHYLS